MLRHHAVTYSGGLFNTYGTAPYRCDNRDAYAVRMVLVKCTHLPQTYLHVDMYYTNHTVFWWLYVKALAMGRQTSENAR